VPCSAAGCGSSLASPQKHADVICALAPANRCLPAGSRCLNRRLGQSPPPRKYLTADWAQPPPHRVFPVVNGDVLCAGHSDLSARRRPFAGGLDASCRRALVGQRSAPRHQHGKKDSLSVRLQGDDSSYTRFLCISITGDYEGKKTPECEGAPTGFFLSTQDVYLGLSTLPTSAGGLVVVRQLAMQQPTAKATKRREKNRKSLHIGGKRGGVSVVVVVDAQ
jgi:hypothetical protein